MQTCQMCGTTIIAIAIPSLSGYYCVSCYKMLQQQASGAQQYQHVSYSQATTVKKPSSSPWTGYNNMTPQPANIRIWWDAAIQAYRLSSPYNKALVEATKNHIPASDRKFDEISKQWIFTEKYLQPFHSLLTTMGFNAVVITRQQAESAAAQTTGTGTGTNGNTMSRQRQPLDAVIVEWVRLLPYDAARTAFRKASMEIHPDKTHDDGKKFAALSSAWDRIAKEVYGQQ